MLEKAIRRQLLLCWQAIDLVRSESYRWVRKHSAAIWELRLQPFASRFRTMVKRFLMATHGYGVIGDRIVGFMFRLLHLKDA